MNKRNHFKSGFLRAALMLTLAVMTFPTKAWADEVKYIDEDGVEKTADAIVLTGTETELGQQAEHTTDPLIETWYVCTTPVSNNEGKGLYYNSGLIIKGHVRLILADGCKMTVENNNNAAIRGGDNINFKSMLSIYDQSNDMTTRGEIVVKGRNGIHFGNGDFIVNGGIVNVNVIARTDYGTKVIGHVIINGGQVSVNGGSNGYGIYAWGDIILGWRNTTDYIQASSYYTYNYKSKYAIKTAEGKPFEYDGGTLSGGTTLTSDQISVISGKKLTCDLWGIADGNDGSETKPYTITTTAGLDLLAMMVNGTDGYAANDFSGKYFKLDADIAYTYHDAWNNDNSVEDNYTAIGNNDHSFSGTFDGGSHTISGIRIYKPSEHEQGLFGGTYDGSVRNVILSNARITGLSFVGGIVGDCGGSIENCHVTVSVTISGLYGNAYSHGGIAGFSTGQIQGCTCAARCYSSDINLIYLGGLVGQNAGILRDNLVVGFMYDNPLVGAIFTDFISDYSIYSNNFYKDCKIENATSGIGFYDTKSYELKDLTENNGAVPGYFLTFGKGVTATAGVTTLTIPAHKDLNATGTAMEAVAAKTYYVTGQSTTAKFTYSGNVPEGYTIDFIVKDVDGNDVSVAETETAGVFSFNMPAKDVTIYGPRYYMTNVPYMTWDDTNKKLVEAKTPDGVKVWILDGTESTLPSGWYIARGNVSYDHTLLLNGNVHLILADGYKMNIGTSDARINGYGIICSGTTESLTIYGQTNGTGALSIYTTGITGDGIYVSALAINGGHVTADTNGSNASALFTVTGDITINGSTVSATVSSFAEAIAAAQGNFIYNGGNVTTNGNGILVIGGDITLGWTKPTDFIKANSYLVDDNKVVKIAEGKNFMVYNGETAAGVISGTVSDLSTINGKKLIPAMSFRADKLYVVNTFEGNWKVAKGAKTFLPTGYNLSTGQVTLEEVIGAPDGLPVIIGPKDEKNPPDAYFLVPAQDYEVDDIEDNYDNVAGKMSKRFVVTDGTKTLADAISGTGVDASEAVILVLANGKFTSIDFSADDLEKKAKAGLLLFVLSKWEYMQIKPSAQPASATLSTRAIGIDFCGETTGIKNVHNVQSESWYDLQGRKISKPTKKGIYIYNGKKVKM